MKLLRLLNGLQNSSHYGSTWMCVDRRIQCNDVNITSLSNDSQENDDCDYMMQQELTSNKFKIGIKSHE